MERLRDLWFLYGLGRFGDEMVASRYENIEREILCFNGYTDSGYTACLWKLYFKGGRLVSGRPLREIQHGRTSKGHLL